MQYRVYDRQTLKYVDGGYVRNYSIDDDYIVNNNSTITVVKKAVSDENYSLSKVTVGDVIALIETSGAFHKGVITAVDDTALTISYKSDKELFNDNMLNPLRSYFLEDGVKVAGKFGIEMVIAIFKALFADTEDEFKKLPITFIANGDVLGEDGKPKMLWTWSDDSINVVDWLTELFEKYNFTTSWTIDFNIAEEDLTKRAPKYVVTFSAITNSGGIIKDNVDMQTITYTTKELPDATVCYVIDSSEKELLSVYYLYEKDGVYSISTDKALTDGRQRVLPVKTTIASYSESSTGTDDTTPEDVATDTLIPSQFNQAIEIRINADSKMFDFVNAQFGDLYKIINEQGTVDSVFTGKKFSNTDKWVALYFGLGRQNYTDLMQIRLRKQKYTSIYNQG